MAPIFSVITDRIKHTTKLIARELFTVLLQLMKARLREGKAAPLLPYTGSLDHS
jgi:hypothetical protein